MGNRDTDDRETHRAKIRWTAGIVASHKSEGESDENSGDQCSGGEFERCGKAFGDKYCYRRAPRDRFTEVAPHRIADERCILSEDRSVEAKLMAHPLDVGGRGRVAEHRDDGIARDEMNKREGQRRNAKGDWDECREAAEDVSAQPITQEVRFTLAMDYRPVELVMEVR
jgi:hypothetical protein